ncbi:MAG: hypothetical protein IJV76_09500, partial [Clostridia bacterium]|nr:hypothetical protein [Clostridia bacterium]
DLVILNPNVVRKMRDTVLVTVKPTPRMLPMPAAAAGGHRSDTENNLTFSKICLKYSDGM